MPGGPRSPLRALSSGSFLAMGSPSPGARWSRDGGWTRTGNREPRTGKRELRTGNWGLGIGKGERAPPQERSGAARPLRRGEPYTHTGVRVLKLKEE